MLIGIDLDGTLLDSRSRHLVALREAANSLNVSLSDETINKYFEIKCDGNSGLTALRLLDVPNPEGISLRWLEIIEDEGLLALDQLYPDALGMLGEAVDRGHQFILVTARHSKESAISQICRLGIATYTTEAIIVDPRDFQTSKGDAAHHWNVDVVIGDSEVDHCWAQDSRVPFYASGFGFRNHSFWARRGIACYSSLTAAFAAIYGQGAMVGAGAAVTRSIESRSLVVNPAKHVRFIAKGGERE
jgi:phosphoglycolate phosphatase-like HAD superfamily hydrolase